MIDTLKALTQTDFNHNLKEVNESEGIHNNENQRRKASENLTEKKNVILRTSFLKKIVSTSLHLKLNFNGDNCELF